MGQINDIDERQALEREGRLEAEGRGFDWVFAQ